MIFVREHYSDHGQYMTLIRMIGAQSFKNFCISLACPALAGYLFSARSAAVLGAVLGSSNVSTPNTSELFQASPAPYPAAPEDGRTPLNRHPAGQGDASTSAVVGKEI